MSFRRQLKATFKDIFGGGGGGGGSSSKNGTDETSRRKGKFRDSKGKKSGLGGQFSPSPAASSFDLNEESREQGVVRGEGNGLYAAHRGVDREKGHQKPPEPMMKESQAELLREKLKYPPSFNEKPPPSHSDHAPPPSYTEVISPPSASNISPPAPSPDGGSSAPSTPWIQALALLTPSERLDLTTHHPNGQSDEQSVITGLLEQSHSLISATESRAWAFTNPLTGSRVSLKSCVQSFVARISTYVRLGDIAIQHSPEITALVWSGVRLVLGLISADAETWGVLVEILDGVAGVMGRCRIYERMYYSSASPGEGAKRVREALVALYAAMLVFTVRCKRYFAQSNTRRIFRSGVKPFEMAFGGIICTMRNAEERLEREVRAASEEVAWEERGRMLDMLGGMSGVAIPELRMVARETNEIVKVVRKAQEEEERREVLGWLSKVRYGDWQREAFRVREPGTGEWLFQRREWKEWLGEVDLAQEVEEWWNKPLCEGFAEMRLGHDLEPGIESQQPGEVYDDGAAHSGGLWLHGLPGTGKTVLTSLIVDRLTKATSSSPDSVLGYFYCSYTESPRRSASTLLATILKQLAVSLGNKLPLASGGDLGLPKSLVDAYRAHKAQGFSSSGLDLSELSEMLFTDILPTVGLKQVYIIIDALDEMDPGERKILFPVLAQLVSYTPPPGGCKVKVFIASRGGQRDVKAAFSPKDGYQWMKMGLEKEDTGGDIKWYIESQVAEVIAGGELLEGDVDEYLRDRIVEGLVSGAEGMFLWVRYQLANLCEQETEYDVHQALRNLPSGMENTYNLLLSRIISHPSASRKRLAIRVLQWMICTTRPLTPKELVEAVAIEPDTDTMGIDKTRMMKGVEAIVDICGNFIAFDEPAGVLRFVHFTVKEFLEKRIGELGGGNSNEGVLKVCLAMLCFSAGWRVQGKKNVGSVGITNEGAASTEDRQEPASGEADEDRFAGKPELALAEYVILNWGHHGKLALESPRNGATSSSPSLEGLHSFLSPTSPTPFNNWISAYSKLCPSFDIHILDAARADALRPNQLFISIYFQFPQFFLQNLLTQHSSLSTPSYYNGWTQYHLAAAIAAHHVLKPLAEICPIVDINTQDTNGRIPLHIISSSRRGARGGTVLWLSHPEAITVKALLQLGCNPALKDSKSGNLPVHLAAEFGNLSALRALLVYCSPNSSTSIAPPIPSVPQFTGNLMVERQQNVWGYTPIHVALFSRHLYSATAKAEIIMHLLALGGHDVNARDSFRMTPLERILKDGHTIPAGDMQRLAQFLYDCGALYDVKKPGLRKVDLREWGRGVGGPPVIMFHSPTVAAYRVMAGCLPGRTAAQAQSMVVLNQMGGRGRVDRQFFTKCLGWCEGQGGI